MNKHILTSLLCACAVTLHAAEKSTTSAPAEKPAAAPEKMTEAGLPPGITQHQPKSGTPVKLPGIDPRAEWFQQAKLGIFLHWGMYAVNGTIESHPFNMSPSAKGKDRNYVPCDEYFAQMKGFTAANYDPAKWAELFRKAGAKYAIITTKHHDGFALFDSKAPGALTAAKDSPAQRDLIKPWLEGNTLYPGHFIITAPKKPDPLTTVIKLEYADMIQLGVMKTMKTKPAALAKPRKFFSEKKERAK
jgi:hypothetical protein